MDPEGAEAKGNHTSVSVYASDIMGLIHKALPIIVIFISNLIGLKQLFFCKSDPYPGVKLCEWSLISDDNTMLPVHGH